MIWLCSPDESARRNYFRRCAKARESARLAISLAVEAVHPGNLGPLPPSPRSLLDRAQQIGLISVREWGEYERALA